jgi:hypothetical protein
MVLEAFNRKGAMSEDGRSIPLDMVVIKKHLGRRATVHVTMARYKFGSGL